MIKLFFGCVCVYDKNSYICPRQVSIGPSSVKESETSQLKGFWLALWQHFGNKAILDVP